jgi:hypothetical protein
MPLTVVPMSRITDGPSPSLFMREFTRVASRLLDIPAARDPYAKPR